VRPTVEQAVDLLVGRGEIRLHSENSVSIALTGLRRLDACTFTGRGPRIRLSSDQTWHVRTVDDGEASTVAVVISGCTVGEIGSTVTATAVSVEPAPVRREQRVEVAAPAQVRMVAAAVERRGQLPGSLVNVSPGGLELVTEAVLVPGDVVEIDARVLEHRLDARCQVVHARADRESGTVVAGLRFLRQQPTVLGMLESIATRPVLEPIVAGEQSRRRFGLRRRRAA
jgi:hypothetical protein